MLGPKISNQIPKRKERKCKTETGTYDGGVLPAPIISSRICFQSRAFKVKQQACNMPMERDPEWTIVSTITINFYLMDLFLVAASITLHCPLCVSHWVVSNSLQPHELYPARLLCPWHSSGKDTGVGSHSLLQGIFPTQGTNPGLPHCRQTLYHLRN